MFSSSMVSARIEPMINAPRADEKPALVAKTTIRKHRPMATKRSVSLLRYFFIFLSRVGIRYIPQTNHITRKNPNLATIIASSLPSKDLLTAKVERITMSKMANKSSKTSIPNTMPANFSF